MAIERANNPNRLSQLLVERINARDVDDDIALTSTQLPGGPITVEVARRQHDGSWKWAIDQPALVARGEVQIVPRQGSMEE